MVAQILKRNSHYSLAIQKLTVVPIPETRNLSWLKAIVAAIDVAETMKMITTVRCLYTSKSVSIFI